ncbi:hypothetical protein [Limimaricola pyoseonensis]|uniref:Uncharacterized protein n=1 Tax=Limimaricola pyoseonensis TaxID=521013 RepID=A0A1G7GRR5_9RHOB|nr:hypothetical protein [Limimaricola pyoseonensis]SDE90659.1 hypothetical protein SAMN04488567_2891 [Limimaricola pyoseonensis]
MTIDILAALRAAAAAPASAARAGTDILADLAALDGPRGRSAPANPAQAPLSARPGGQGVRPSLRDAIEAQVAAANREARTNAERREPWPEHWWAGTDSADVSRCQMLWQEVLRHCLMSVTDDVLEAQRRGRPARPTWIGTPDFALVCDLAGFDSSAVAERVVARLRDPNGALTLRRHLAIAPRASEEQE